MNHRPPTNNKARPTRQRSVALPADRLRQGVPQIRRGRGMEVQRPPFVPPEDWYEPTDDGAVDFRVVQQPPGRGYRHVVTPAEVRARLAVLPQHLLRPLQVVQLSRMTRKKKTFPCYGMQWGSALYLYPMEEGLIEYFDQPPRPAQLSEARGFGGRWVQRANHWKLVWTEAALKDFYLNNVLLHELGHLLDDRNTSYNDRERFAEWFARRYAQTPQGRRKPARRATRKIVRRHGRK